MIDPNNHTRWKHTWRWHNRGSVWNRIPSEWAGAEERSDRRRRCQDAVRKKDSVTFAKMRLKDWVAHGPQIRESIKPNEEKKGTRKLGPPYFSIALSNEGATAQTCGRQQCG